MAKDIKFDVEARDPMVSGIQKLSQAVSVTLGPQGRNVFIKTLFHKQITKDGVTVAKLFELEDPLENEGANLVKEVAIRTNELAGDGTSTATLLAEAIVTRGLRNLAAGANPLDLKKGIDKTATLLYEELDKITKVIGADADELKQIAMISANNDEEIGTMIGDIYSKVGKEGVVTIEQSPTSKTYTDVVDGLRFDRGFIAPYFMTNPEKQECNLAKPLILIYNGKLSNMKQIMPAMEVSVGAGRTLLVIAEDVDGQALKGLVVNRMEHDFGICAVKAPGFGSTRTALLEDIAILTGATVISPGTDNIENYVAKPGEEEKSILEALGSCESLAVTQNETTIVDGSGSKSSLVSRLAQIKGQRESEEDEYQQNVLNERIAKLQNGVGVIYVGAVSEIERSEKKDRIEDAKNATKAALEEGIVIGGGVALVRASSKVIVETENDDEDTGVNILLDAVQQPLITIVDNAEDNQGVVVLANVKKSKKKNYGYDAKRGEYVDDMFKAGIVDPKKVTRIALENAVSVATMVLTTECTMVHIPNKDDIGSTHML